MRRENDYVYFIRPVGLDGPIKIGCSNLPERRLAQLSVWSPFPLELVGSVPASIQDEHFLHCCFANDHCHHEWFRSSQKLRDAISAVLSAGTVDVVRDKLEPVGNLRKRVKRAWTEQSRLRRSYGMRIYWAVRKLRAKIGEDGAWHEPDDVAEIMSNWAGYRGQSVIPSAADLHRIEQYLTDPEAHSVIPPWRRQKEAA